jgi:oligopeptide/dipeptide ABC transporter ATP-binding protein
MIACSSFRSRATGQAAPLKNLGRPLRFQQNRDPIGPLCAPDLSVVRLMCVRIEIIYLGKIVEQAPTDRTFNSRSTPIRRCCWKRRQPSTSAERETPPRSPDRTTQSGNVPSGCAFRTRCPYATEICAVDTPPLQAVSDGHAVVCHHWAEIPARNQVSSNAPKEIQAPA